MVLRETFILQMTWRDDMNSSSIPFQRYILKNKIHDPNVNVKFPSFRLAFPAFPT